MKELSIEEKAKRYDEAIKRANSKWQYRNQRCFVDVAEIFPELKESEDERIRKKIIATIHLYYGEPLEDEAKEMIAWLEKQGEQKVSIINFKANDWYVSKVDGKIHNAKFMEKSTNQARRLEIEKVAMSVTGIIEQAEWFIKGAEWSDKNPYISSEKQGSWSEEDERCIRDSIFYLKSAKKYLEKDDDILWNEKWFNLCIEWLESLYKMLRPQNTWKPSDEQMKCLGYAIEKAEKDWSPLTNNRVYLTLKALKEQLLELRGSKV